MMTKGHLMVGICGGKIDGNPISEVYSRQAKLIFIVRLKEQNVKFGFFKNQTALLCNGLFNFFH